MFGKILKKTSGLEALEGSKVLRGGALGGAIGGIPGAMLGGLAGSGLGDSLAPSFEKPAPPPEVDPRLKEIRDRQFKLAGDFKAAAPGLQAQEQTQATDFAKEDLATQKMQVGQAANQRGLLYSGLRSKGEADASQMSASNLAKRRMDIAKGFEEKQQALEAKAFDAGARVQDLEQQRFDTMYKQDMDNKRLQLAANQSPVGLIGGGLKAIGGIL